MAAVRVTPTADGAGARRDAAAIWTTCAPDLVEHAITDASFAAGRARGDGVYVALCGVRVVAASMLSAPVIRCSACGDMLHPRVRSTVGTRRLHGKAGHRKPGRLVRVVRRWWR